jgi:hypothetical protein
MFTIKNNNMTEVSEKQLEANRQNAQKGGVKTDEGKAVSRYNALKHGLLSQEVLLKGEDEEMLIELGKQLRGELKPANEMELILVDRIIANTWRLKRALKAETGMIYEDCNGLGGRKTLGEALSYDLSNYDTYGKFSRYEGSIERGLYKALHELQRVQAARLGQRTALPVAIDLEYDHEE